MTLQLKITLKKYKKVFLTIEEYIYIYIYILNEYFIVLFHSPYLDIKKKKSNFTLIFKGLLNFFDSWTRDSIQTQF